MPHLPPGWPPAVRPADAPGWVRSAVAWLYDQCPPDYRGYDVLRTHPVALARLAHDCTAAALTAARQGFATARADLVDVLDPPALEALLRAYEQEGRRLRVALRAVELVRDALGGARPVPRL